MADLQALLDELCVANNAVGATLGVLKDGAIQTWASGLLNLDTRVEATPDSVFQIGSIGKIFTTTLIMQLADEGRLDVDDPVIRHLSDFTTAERDYARAITIRQLLNHTSGLEGDFFPADDADGPSTASYVRKMALLPSMYAPGEGPMTYCNSGFVTAGRIVELLTGMTWQRAVVERIIKPLGLSHVVAFPQDGLRYRMAMGHVTPDPKDQKTLKTAPATYLSLSAAAAGSVLSMSVESVLRFAQAHMADGVFNGGKQLLSSRSARRMRDERIAIPPFSRRGVTGWGLGWMLCPQYGMCGHDGGTLGQFTYLRTFPERNIAFALFTNAPSGKLYERIEAHLMETLIGETIASEPPEENWTPDPARFAGTYENIAAQTRIGSDLSLEMTSKIGMPGLRAKLKPYRPDTFTLSDTGTPSDGDKIVFLGEGREATFMRQGTRMAKRR
ncbi:MAG: beta-lactamase family protein [Pseudolabrys sp.]|nr:beta-lactamase family protein [Pseudolabrys sp.]